MKLFYSPGACSLSPHIILQESGLKHTTAKTNLKDKTIDGGGDYKQKNPHGYVPALELDDGTIITEGPSVLQYIAEKAGNTSVSPAVGTPERYRMLSWLNFTSTELHGPFGSLFNPAMPDAGKEIAKAKLASRFKFLDQHLAGKDYLLGKAFTLPDAYAFAVLGWAPAMKIDMSGYPNIKAYVARIAARPAVQKAMGEEGLAKAA